MVVEASDIRFQKAIGKQTFFASAPKNQVRDADIYKLPFKHTPGHYLPHDLPGRLVEQDCFLEFALNSCSEISAIVPNFLKDLFLKSLASLNVLLLIS